jgi:hypothetical protein
MLAWLWQQESQLPGRLRQEDQGLPENKVFVRPVWTTNGYPVSHIFKGLNIYLSGTMLTHCVGGLTFHLLVLLKNEDINKRKKET